MKQDLIAVCCLLAALASGAARAQTGEDDAAARSERQRIAAERQQVEQRFAQDEAACFQKFAVNDCRDASRTHRRAALADLRRQEILLNDAERKRKGALQLQRMEQSAAPDSAASAAGAAQPREKSSIRVRTHTPAAPRQAHDPAQAASAQAARKAVLESKNRLNQEEQAARDRRAASAPEQRARYEKKLQEAADHQAQIEQRKAARTKPLAAPLPEPAP